MLICSSSLAARFSAAASTYHSLANIQRRVAEKLMTLLAVTHPVPARILEIGCGTGVLTEMLTDIFPFAKVDAVDVSGAMTVKARSFSAGNRMINWIIADACQLPENIKYPLIISNCALHWIAPIELIIAKLASLLEQDGRLAFAVMLRGTLAELNATRQRVAPHKPPRVAMPAENEVQRAISKARLKICAENLETIRFEYPSAAEMLKQLHDQGLTGGNILHNKSLLSRSELSWFVADYKKNYCIGQRVYATYEVLYCIAEK